MKEILLKQFGQYPEMQIVDAVKLLYQSEFGGGHLINDAEKSLLRIKQEWTQMNHISEGSLIEEIGDGICRIDLSILKEGLDPQTLNQMFIRSAEKISGTVIGFERKLACLREMCIYGELLFDVDELDQYISEYKNAEYPPVSHSENYRTHYHPNYRVILSEYARYISVFCKIDRIRAGNNRKQTIVGIDGMCGSGKSTLGHILKEIYDCNLFYMDDYFLRPEQRTESRLAEPGGNVDYERFREEIFNHLSDPDGITYQVYHCGIQKLDKVVSVPYKTLNIIEGTYSHHPYFGDPYDLKLVCKISSEEQERRILKRNGPELFERFKNVWIPMENVYFKTFDIEGNGIIV